MALQLLLELLPRPGEPVAAPVPVLFSLASWVPARYPRVQDWLVEQLGRTCPALRAVDPGAARALVGGGRILPILDGLDEVGPARRAAPPSSRR